MKIEIKNRFNGNIIISGKYESIKECLEKNREADLRGADLREADLREADLWGADLREADLREADLRGADLREADLRGAYLWEADLREADLREADLREADLREADLREADLWEADLREADLREADLWGAYLREAKGINIPVIYIQGSRHLFQYVNNKIKIGCYEYTIDEWKEKYKGIGNKNGYSEKEINEYYNYVLMCEKLSK